MKRDKIIIIDLEASCWKKKPPPGQQSEIIEIGVCLLDVTALSPENKRSLIIKPMRSKISEFCTKLTSLTQEQVDEGINFAAACDVLRDDYRAGDYLWASWGDYDKRMFKWQCDEFGVPSPLSDHHMNIKQLYADVRNKGKRRGLLPAMKAEQIDMEGRHHRGDDDAWNTARMLAKLIREGGRDILTPYWGEDDT